MTHPVCSSKVSKSAGLSESKAEKLTSNSGVLPPPIKIEQDTWDVTKFFQQPFKPFKEKKWNFKEKYKGSELFLFTHTQPFIYSVKY